MMLGRLMELAEKKKVKGILCCVDFKGAFDTVRHDFIWQTMRKMNVGEGLINHLKTLYKNAK